MTLSRAIKSHYQTEQQERHSPSQVGRLTGICALVFTNNISDPFGRLQEDEIYYRVSGGFQDDMLRTKHVVTGEVLVSLGQSYCLNALLIATPTDWTVIITCLYLLCF